MSVISIKRDASMNVCIVRMICTDSLTTVASANYIEDQMDEIRNLNDGFWQWFSTDVLLVAANDGNALFQFTDDSFTSLVLIASSTDGTVSPGLQNQVAYYPVNGATVSGTNNLPAQVQVPVGSLNSGINANGGHFWRGDGIWATVASSTDHSIYNVYVSPDGSDLLGNGTILAPYQTINHALSQITTASQTTPFKIICLYGEYNETTILLKPWISIDGQNSVLNVTGDIFESPLWIGGGYCFFGNFASLTLTGNFTLNLSIAGANACTLEVRQIQFSSVANVSVIGGDSLILVMFALYSFGASLSIYIENAYGAINGCSPSALDYVASNTVFGYNFQFQDTYVIGNMSVTTNVGAVGISSFFNSCKLLGGFQVDGVGTVLNIDCNSLLLSSLPVITGGAVVNYINVANTLDANYTPVNYTPDATGGTDPVTSVAAHLHGIDNAIPVIVQTHDVWVSNQGSNVTGNGTVTNPYQTIEYALTQITTNSPTEIFRIVCTTGIYNENTLYMKPWVYLEGNGATLNTLEILADASYPAAGGDCIISNFYNCNITNGIFFVLQGVAPALNSTITVRDFTFYGNGRVTIYGNDIDAFYTTAIISNVDSLYGSVEIEMKNVGGILEGCQHVQPFTYLSTNPGVSFGFEVSNCYFFTASTVTNTGGLGCNITFNSNNMLSTLTATGAGAALTLDSNSIRAASVPSLVGGATASYVNVSDAIDANYTPTSYTATTGQVKGHLEGINNALQYEITDNIEVTGTSQAGAVRTRYITNNAALVTVTLPASANVGEVIEVTGKGAGGWLIQAGVGQIIHVGTVASTVGGTVSSIAQWSSLKLVCVTSSSTWTAIASVGTFAFA